MNTPWINYKNMEKISSNQQKLIKSSTRKRKPKASQAHNHGDREKKKCKKCHTAQPLTNNDLQVDYEMVKDLDDHNEVLFDDAINLLNTSTLQSQLENNESLLVEPLSLSNGITQWGSKPFHHDMDPYVLANDIEINDPLPTGGNTTPNLEVERENHEVKKKNNSNMTLNVVDSLDCNQSKETFDQHLVTRFQTVQIPFKIMVEIDTFHRAPIFGDITEQSFEFLNLDNKCEPELDTKLMNMTMLYPESPYCRLLCTKIHEMIFFSALDPSPAAHTPNILITSKHDTKRSKKNDVANGSSLDYILIRVPVIVGEYEIELCLEENVVFQEEVKKILNVSKEVVIKDCQFVPTKFSETMKDGTVKAEKGRLFLQGQIHQQIEFVAGEPTRSNDQKQQLKQKLVLQLLIHLLQIQKVRVCFENDD